MSRKHRTAAGDRFLGLPNLNRTRNLGVAYYKTGENGTRYAITYDDNGQIAGAVEVVGSFYNVRDYNDEPVRVGSSLYHAMKDAVTDFIAWQAKH